MAFLFSNKWEFQDPDAHVKLTETIDGKVLLKLLASDACRNVQAPDAFYRFKDADDATDDRRIQKKRRLSNTPPPKYSMFDVLTHYNSLRWAKQGNGIWSHEVIYTRAKNISLDSNLGRLYAGNSAQTFKREYRDTIFHIHSTIDFENCYYRILNGFLVKYFPSLSREKVDDYIEHRDMHRRRVAEQSGLAYNSPEIKELYSGILMGMGLQTWRSKHRVSCPLEFERDLVSEVASIRTYLSSHCRILTDSDLALDPDADSHTVAVKNISRIVQTIESKLLMQAASEFELRGYTVVFLLHDGMEISGRHEDKYELAEEVSKAVCAVSGYDIPMKWKEKTIINLDDSIDIEDDSYEGVKLRFEEIHFKVILQNCFYSLDKTTMTYTIASNKMFKEQWQHLQYKTNAGVLEQFVAKWMNDRDLRVYDYAGMFPLDGSCPANCFNTFTGFHIASVTVDDQDRIEQASAVDSIKKLLRRIVENDDHYAYVVRYIAHMFKHWNTKPRVCIVFQSAMQGIGKGTLGLIITRMIGRMYCFKTSKTEAFLGQFNGLIHNKIFGIIDEVSVSRSDYEQWKNLISESTITIRNMHMSPIVTDCYMHYFNFLNQGKAVCTLEEKERRFFVTGSTSDKLTDEEGKLYSELCKNEKAMRIWYDELMAIDVDANYAFDEHRPVSVLYERLKELYRAPEITFMVEFLLSICYPLPCDGRQRKFYNNITITVSDLFKRYTTYLAEIKCQHTMTMGGFSMRVESGLVNPVKYGVSRKRSQKGGHDRMVWVFSNVIAVLAHFTDHQYLDRTRYEQLRRFAETVPHDGCFEIGPLATSDTFILGPRH